MRGSAGQPFLRPATVLWIAALALLAPASAGAVTVKDPGRYVVDTAGLIDAATERRMEGWLRELEQKTTAQVKVLTVPTTGGEDFFGFVQRHAEAWKLGRKGKDNGALIALAVKERRVRVHTGYGLEGVLPDSLGRHGLPPGRRGLLQGGQVRPGIDGPHRRHRQPGGGRGAREAHRRTGLPHPRRTPSRDQHRHRRLADAGVGVAVRPQLPAEAPSPRRLGRPRRGVGAF